MSLTKTDIVTSFYSHCGFSRTKSIEMAESALEIMKKNLEPGDYVLMSRFGKFNVNEKRIRKKRNPATGDDSMQGARRVVTFRCSTVLRQKLNRKG